mmetsp:Transcript_43117/g.31500  ORF Transcript_43117/g.31500 Transcript_43117/m.31500 type:complete len:84 (-) Transcript_43117:712-963(-)
MFGIWFRKSFVEISSTRTVASLSKAFSGLGGLLNIIIPVCAFIVGPYASTAYNNALLRKLYKCQGSPSDDNDESPKSKNEVYH